MIRGELAQRARHLADDRSPFVLATVVRASRPTSARPGDNAIVLADGSIEGFVGGVCAESSVRLHGLRVLETGEPLLLALIPGNPGNPEDTDGGGAEAAEGSVVEHNPCLSGGSLEIFLEPQLPPPRITVLGTSPIAVAIERVALASGFEVIRGGVGEVSAKDADAGLIVASHGAGEEAALSAALSAGVPYVALIASDRRGAAVRESLDLPAELRELLHTPAGLEIGALTPEEIAISVLAELIATRRSRPDPERPATAVAVDPICGMEVAISEATPSLESRGTRHYFCGEGCRSAYAAQHAGDVSPR